MTFVTGMYRDEEEVVDNILRTVGLVKREGFSGRVLYIGSQIQSPDLADRLIEGLEGTDFKYAYTLETFSLRDKMHMQKNIPLEESLSVLSGLRGAGISNLEYSYMPGIDSLDDFNEWMPRFSKLARPHLSIFRPTEKEQEELKDVEFIEDPVGYLCVMRKAFEEEHGEPVYQNNLGSLWGFPIERINPLFLTNKTGLS